MAEWIRALAIFSFQLSFDFQTMSFLTAEVRVPPRVHSFHYCQYHLSILTFISNINNVRINQA